MPLPLIAAGIGGLASLLGGLFGHRSEDRAREQARQDQERMLREAASADAGDFLNREAVRTGVNRTRAPLFAQAAANRGYHGAAYDTELTTPRSYGGFDPLRALAGQRLQPTAGAGSSTASDIFGSIASFMPYLAMQGQKKGPESGLSPEIEAFIRGALQGGDRSASHGTPPLASQVTDPNCPPGTPPGTSCT